MNKSSSSYSGDSDKKVANINQDSLNKFMNKSSSCSGDSDKKLTNLSQDSYQINSMSSESDLSFSLCYDREIDEINNQQLINTDELPAFEIRLISPLGRTPSPIDNEVITSPARNYIDSLTPSPRHNNPDFVMLQDINAQISPPSDDVDNNINNLETIYEGVFLNTPPSQTQSLHRGAKSRNRSRTNLFEKATNNRRDKENHSPVSDISKLQTDETQ